MSWTKWRWACWPGVFRFSPASNHYNEALQASLIILQMYNRPDYLAQSKVLVTLGSHPVLHVHRKYRHLHDLSKCTVNAWTATDPITVLHLWRELTVNSITVFAQTPTQTLKWGHPRSLMADSHVPCRAHAVSMPRPFRDANGLECVFPIWFTQCGRVWFTLAMPCPCHAPTMPFFLRPQHSTAVKRRPCCAAALRRTAWSEHGIGAAWKVWIRHCRTV